MTGFLFIQRRLHSKVISEQRPERRKGSNHADTRQERTACEDPKVGMYQVCVKKHTGQGDWKEVTKERMVEDEA